MNIVVYSKEHEQEAVQVASLCLQSFLIGCEYAKCCSKTYLIGRPMMQQNQGPYPVLGALNNKILMLDQLLALVQHDSRVVLTCSGCLT